MTPQLRLVDPSPSPPPRRVIPANRHLRLAGVYGQPGGEGLNSLARLLLNLAAEDDSPDHAPDRRLLLSPQQQGPA